MKMFVILLAILITTLACGPTSMYPSRSLAVQTGLPRAPVELTLAPSRTPTETPTLVVQPTQPAATPTLVETAAIPPTETPVSLPTLEPSPSPSPSDVTLTPTDGAAASAAGTITIVGISYDGSGDKEPDEYVEIRNDSDQTIELGGWKLKDKADHLFTFPEFVIQPAQVCRIYTDELHPDSCGFSFNFDRSAIWNNGGDCAYLSDQDGKAVTEYCY